MIVFRSNRAGRYDLYRKPADGSRNEELLYADNLLKMSMSFSPDGKYLAYWAQGDPKTEDDSGSCLTFSLFSPPGFMFSPE